MGVGYEEKTVLHSFKEVVVEFEFKNLKLVCERWELRSVLRLKSQIVVELLCSKSAAFLFYSYIGNFLSSILKQFCIFHFF